MDFCWTVLLSLSSLPISKFTVSWKFIVDSITYTFLYFCKISLGGKDPDYLEFTWGKSFVLAVSGITLRGWDKTPTKTSARISFIV